MARLCTAGTTLRAQVDKRFPKRDRRSDGWIGDSAHSVRFSYHNPDRNGIVWALDVDENFGQGSWRNGRAARRFADQLVDYVRSGLPGSDRVLHVVYEDQVVSGTHRAWWWIWRGKGYGHLIHIHITFKDSPGNDARPFPLPILTKSRTQMKAWSDMTRLALLNKGMEPTR